MQVHLRRTDATVRQIIAASFPGYKGNRISAVPADRIRFSGTQWDGGSRSRYVVVRLADMRTMSVAEAPFMRRSAAHENDFTIPEGFVVVEHEYFRGIQFLKIHTPPANITRLLPPPVDLSEDERIVLTFTRSRKPSYNGISNYRFHTAHRETGITAERYEAAKQSLIAKRYLNKAGAITPEGRNVLASPA